MTEGERIDQTHPHVHCVVNRVDPNDGRMAVLSKDRAILSKWAHEYERQRGPLLTPKRARNYAPERSMERAAEKEPASNQRAMMAELDAAQRKRHKAEWRVLDQTYSAERKGVLEKFQSVKALTAAHLRERQAKETALYNCQTQELTNFARRGRGLVGRVRLAIETAREQRTPGDGQLSFAGQVIGFALSPQKILEIFERRHHAARAAFAR